MWFLYKYIQIFCHKNNNVVLAVQILCTVIEIIQYTAMNENYFLVNRRLFLQTKNTNHQTTIG